MYYVLGKGVQMAQGIPQTSALWMQERLSV